MATRDLDQRSDDILTRRPDIRFEEPPLVDDEARPPEKQDTIDDLTEKSDQTARELETAIRLADVIQQQIDQAAKDFSINLHPQADVAIVDAVKRMFPEKKDPTVITYNMYRECISHYTEQNTLAAKKRAEDQKTSTDSPFVTLSDSINAISDPQKLTDIMSDPYRTSFGGMTTADGLRRLELDPSIQVQQRVDVAAVKNEQIKELFSLMKTDIITLILQMIGLAPKDEE